MSVILKCSLVTLFSTILALHGFSQNIFLETSNKVDEFNKSISIQVIPKEEVLRGKKVMKNFLSVEDENNTIVFINYLKPEDGSEYYRIVFRKTIDLGCVSKYDGKLLVLFENGETLTLQQQSETDCGDTITPAYYFASPETLKSDSMVDFQAEQNKIIDKFLSSNILKVRLYGTKHYDEIEFRPQAQDIVKKMLNRVDEELEL